jgi:hypothetical protein
MPYTQLLLHLAWRNKNMSFRIVKLVCETIEDVTDEENYAMLHLLADSFNMRDGVQVCFLSIRILFEAYIHTYIKDLCYVSHLKHE